MVISYSDYLELLELRNKHKKVKAIMSHGIEIPEEVTRRINKGESPVRAWRHYRDLTQTDLAALAGISLTLLSLIENSIRDGSNETHEALARALDIPVGLLDKL